MKTTPLRLIIFCFAIFCLASGLSPLSLAWGAKVVIDNPVIHTVNGNGSAPNGELPNQATPLDPNNNEVIINANVGSNVIGGFSVATGSATGNTVTINSGTVGGSVWGGQATSSTAVTGNSVIINGGTVGAAVYGGEAAGNSNGSSVAATDNSVTINSGTVTNHIYGNYVNNNGGSAEATGSSVTINGGQINGNVYAAYAASTVNGTAFTATGNSVTISGDAQFAATSEIHAAYNANVGSSFTSTDNTLNLYTSIAVQALSGFQNMNLYPADLNPGKPMLTISGGTIDISGAVINVNIPGESSAPGLNDEAGLLVAGAGGIITDSETQIRGTQGVTLRYEFDIMDVANRAAAVVRKIEVNEQTKSLAEGFLAGTFLVNQGADLVAGLGIDRAVLAAGESGFGAFAAASYGQSDFETGSSVDISGFSLLSGFSRGVAIAPGHLTLGAFFEYGNGDYDTENSFAGAANVRGEGKADHLGGGILSRMDFSQGQSGHAWLEGTARAGRVENDYNSHNLRDFLGHQTGFDSSSTYYGLHLGAGYVWDISEKTALDLYAKYFWSRTAGDDVTLDTGDSVEFDDVDSHRLRLGGRLALNQTGIVRPYIGLAWEHEFDGEAQSAAAGHSIDAPTVRGDTGIGEIGLSIKPAPDTPLSFDLGLSGFVGQRQGAMGTLSIRYDF